jgi:hypothetical protein
MPTTRRLAVTSEELAKEIMNAVVAVQGRILGVGKEQYDQGDEQKFERMSFRELIQYAREEVEDGIAYNVMLRWKLGQMEKALSAAYAGYEENPGRHVKQAESVFTPMPPTEAKAAVDKFEESYPELRDLARNFR